jgi:hypothetical protein
MRRISGRGRREIGRPVREFDQADFRSERVAMFSAPTHLSAQLIITASGDLLGDDTPENRELARRVKACINACHGLTTEELERGVVQELCQTIRELEPLLKSLRSSSERAA